MSYILDALRRADAERERGRVPGIHSQVAPRSPGTPQAVARKRPARGALPWALTGGALLLGLAWWLGRTTTDAPATPSPAVSGPVAPTAAPATPAAAPIAAPAVIAPPAAAPAPAPIAAAEPVRPILAPAPAAPPAPPAQVTRPATAAPSAGATTADTPPPRLADLSPEARAQIPPVQVSGSTYSDNAALRMLIINGKVVQEGQDIAPELRLESIGPRTAVINHRGQRYRINH